jgi:glycerol-3-phosphate acyltransferase PlsY
VIAFTAIALLSYLIGAIPAGYLAGRIAGVDIRKSGSGNIGATNVTRVLGKRYGYTVFFADLLKGFGTVWLAAFIQEKFALSYPQDLLPMAAGVFCIMGNAFPVWLHFRGGKGVATSAGVFFGLTPLAAAAAFLIWVVTFRLTRYVSIASMTASLALPAAVFVLTHFMHTRGPLVLYVSIGLAIIVILRHRSNVSRLMRGTEQRFQRNED